MVTASIALTASTTNPLIFAPRCSNQTPAYDAHDEVRDGAWVAELTDLVNLAGCPQGHARDRAE